MVGHPYVRQRVAREDNPEWRGKFLIGYRSNLVQDLNSIRAPCLAERVPNRLVTFVWGRARHGNTG